MSHCSRTTDLWHSHLTSMLKEKNPLMEKRYYSVFSGSQLTSFFWPYNFVEPTDENPDHSSSHCRHDGLIKPL